MAEKRFRCPLYDYPEGSQFREEDIPDECLTQCEALWDRAITDSNTDGPYDTYPQSLIPHDEECESPDSELEYSSSTLNKLRGSKRSYVIVDQCVSCSTEFGEQGYVFECPYNNKP
jgi:hypothetical protein